MKSNDCILRDGQRNDGFDEEKSATLQTAQNYFDQNPKVQVLATCKKNLFDFVVRRLSHW